MRVATNESLISKKGAMARNAMTTGLVLMVMAAVMAFSQRYIAYAYASLLVSFPLVSWGASGATKWLRDPRPDQVLSKTLKSLDHSYQLYSYTLPVDNVLLCPKGLFALNVTTADGNITCRGNSWHREFKLSRLLGLLAEARLGNPGNKAQAEAKKLGRFVAAQLPDMEVHVQPVVVFVDPGVKLEVSEPAVPAVLAGDLKAYLREVDTSLTAPVLKAVGKLFNDQTS
jgi:hypothetical protein